mgnify:CR=1 FL=1
MVFQNGLEIKPYHHEKASTVICFCHFDPQHLLQLVDVRTPEEYGVSHLKDAQNICVTEDDFKEKVAGLDKDKPVYVYCKKGGRSARASKILQEMGFKEVYDLQGGITAWEEEGLQTDTE